jgi:hypothetical protein
MVQVTLESTTRPKIGRAGHARPAVSRCRNASFVNCKRDADQSRLSCRRWVHLPSLRTLGGGGSSVVLGTLVPRPCPLHPAGTSRGPSAVAA